MVGDPIDGVPLPRMRRAEHAMEIPTPEQVAAIIQQMPVHLRAFVAICAFAGLRLGEARALRLSDIDFLGRQIHVRQQAQKGADGELEIRAPKYGSERTVYVADELLQMINAHLDIVGASVEHGYLFYAGKDPVRVNSVHWHWRQARTKAGLPGVRVHDLRHYFASGLIAAGVDVVAVQRALGHSRASTTLNVYSHLWPSAEDRTRAAGATMIQAASGNLADSLRTGIAASA